MTTIALAAAAEMVQHLLPEVLDHHLGLLLDVVRMQAHELGQRPRRLLLRQVRIVFDRLHQPVVGGVGRVVLQHVEDEAFLDGLPHAVEVKRLRQCRLRPGRPNSSSVLPLGVAVKAKKLRFGCRPRDCITWFSRSSQSGSSSSFSGCAAAPRIAFSSRAVSPVWLECASSTMTAYRRLAISASHALACCLLLRGRLLLRLRAGGMQQPAQHERETSAAW